MPGRRNAERHRPSTFQHRGISAFSIQPLALRSEEGEVAVQPSSPEEQIVAFVKEEAYKRFEDLQHRAAELGRYL